MSEVARGGGSDGERMDSGLHLSAAGRVERWGWIVVAAATLGLATVELRAAAGMALGGGLTLGFLSLNKALVHRWGRSSRRSAKRAALWAIWLVKWPALGGLLWLTVTRDWVSLGWLCAGAAVVPALATGVVIRAVLADGRRGSGATGAGR